MDMVALSATARTLKRTPRQLRADALVPCVVYGNKTENIALQCTYADMYKAYAKAGESTLVDLAVEGKKIPALFHAVDFHPVSGRIIHADFFAVDMKKEIEASVPVHFTGESPAVKTLGAIFVPVHDHVTVRCLPSNLPHELTVDISTMAEFDDTITVAQIALPEGVTIDDDVETVLAIAQEPRKEEEVVPVAADATAAEGAAAPADGAAAPAAAAEPAKK